MEEFLPELKKFKGFGIGRARLEERGAYGMAVRHHSGLSALKPALISSKDVAARMNKRSAGEIPQPVVHINHRIPGSCNLIMSPELYVLFLGSQATTLLDNWLLVCKSTGWKERVLQHIILINPYPGALKALIPSSISG